MTSLPATLDTDTASAFLLRLTTLDRSSLAYAMARDAIMRDPRDVDAAWAESQSGEAMMGFLKAMEPDTFDYDWPVIVHSVYEERWHRRNRSQVHFDFDGVEYDLAGYDHSVAAAIRRIMPVLPWDEMRKAR